MLLAHRVQVSLCIPARVIPANNPCHQTIFPMKSGDYPLSKPGCILGMSQVHVLSHWTKNLHQCAPINVPPSCTQPTFLCTLFYCPCVGGSADARCMPQYQHPTCRESSSLSPPLGGAYSDNLIRSHFHIKFYSPGPALSQEECRAPPSSPLSYRPDQRALPLKPAVGQAELQ